MKQATNISSDMKNLLTLGNSVRLATITNLGTD